MNWFRKSSPVILCLVATAGVIGTAIFTAKATPKALQKLKEAKDEKGEELTVVETVKTVAPSYIPAAVIGVGTVACIFGSNALTKRNQIALIGAYTLLEQSFKEYKDKLKELYGEAVCKHVENSIHKEDCEEIICSAPTFVSNAELLPHEINEPIRTFYDSYSNRYFESTLDRVIQAEYFLNRDFSLGQLATVNDFYAFLGLEPIRNGNHIGWDTCDGFSWIDFNNRIVVLDDGMEIINIDMMFIPKIYDSDD